MAEDRMLQEAIDAIRAGQLIRARDLITRLLNVDQKNPEYWLWLSSVVDSTNEKIYCLKNVLKIDPENPYAHRGLILLGEHISDVHVDPVPNQKRDWQIDVQKIDEPRGFRAFWANPIFRFVFITSLTVFVIAFLTFGTVRLNEVLQKPVVYIPTNTPGSSPTFTYTPTVKNYSQIPITATPSFEGPQPLWMRLEATYTPTPLYVNTPHPAYEAYSMAQQAYQMGELDSALELFHQVATMIPDAPDIPFFIAEVSRLRGDHHNALSAYNNSLDIDPNFAPAYLGKITIEHFLDPQKDILKELSTTINLDPNFAQAFLTRADYLIDLGDFSLAEEDIQTASSLIPESPLPHLLKAKLFLIEGKNQQALVEARQALIIDETILDTYLVLAEAAALSEAFEEAADAIQIYLEYEPNDPTAWCIQSQTYLIKGEFEQAIDAADLAILLDRNYTDAYLFRGMAYIEMDEGQKAINDIYNAKSFNPGSYEINLQFARALLSAGRLGDALSQINRTFDLATQTQDDLKMIRLYFTRAIIYEAIGNEPSALNDWNKLLEFSQNSVPSDIWQTAENHVNSKNSSTLSPTEKKTATYSPSSTEMKSPSETP